MLNEAAKKTMLRHIPHGLYICGTKDGDDVNGFTASWVMQGSFEPPLAIVCVKADSTSHAMIKSGEVFSLSVVEEGQKSVAQNFFKPVSRVGNKFEEIEFYPGEETGCPIIKDSLGYGECPVVGSSEKGDNTLLGGEAVGAG